MQTVASWRELAKLTASCQQLLALGVFSWSNYSREAQLALRKSEPLFSAHAIGLATFELGEPYPVARVCPAFLRHFFFAVTEPACLLLRNGALVAVRFGRVNAEDALAWVLSGPSLSSTPDLSGHPHPELIAPDLEKALADEEESVRQIADELLQELNRSGETA